MKKDTLITRSGTIDETQYGCVNVPIYRSSTIIFPTIEDYNKASKGEAFYKTSEGIRSRDFSYGTSGTPTTHALQRAVAELENAKYALISPSGLAAITNSLLALLKAGDHLLMVDSVYGPTRRFCNNVLKNLNIETTYYDPRIGKDIQKLIKKNTKVIFMESPGSLTFELQDIPAICKVAKLKNIITIVDNSWATGLYLRPIDLGADVSIQAATKYIGGHSDLLLGTVSASGEAYDKISAMHHNLGSATSPDDCYLALRGLRTMATRLKRHEESANLVANWLEKRKEVSAVLYPNLKSHPDYKIFKRDFSGATGLLSFILNEEYNFDQLCNMINNYDIFRIGASWGGFESLVMVFDPKPIRTATKWTKKGLCVRLYIGLENSEDIIKDLENGFKRLKNATNIKKPKNK